MMKFFYYYIMKFWLNKKYDWMGEFVWSVYDDYSFLKFLIDYDELSFYLEFNGYYLLSMIVFDEVWEFY